MTMVCEKENQLQLNCVGGKYMLEIPGNEGPQPVTVKFARPLSGRASEIVFMDEKKRECAMVPSLDALEAESRKVAQEALRLGYLITRIMRVNKTSTRMGARFWSVDTDRGPLTFAMKDPSRNVSYMEDGRMVLWDTLGNCYEIESMESMDEHSQKEMRRII